MYVQLDFLELNLFVEITAAHRRPPRCNYCLSEAKSVEFFISKLNFRFLPSNSAGWSSLFFFVVVRNEANTCAFTSVMVCNDEEVAGKCVMVSNSGDYFVVA